VTENVGGTEERIMFIDPDFEVREVVYPTEITRGGHLLVRDQLLDQNQLRAIVHLGLLRGRFNRVFIHVINPDADSPLSQEKELAGLFALRQSHDHLYWVPTSPEARTAWSKSWYPG